MVAAGTVAELHTDKEGAFRPVPASADTSVFTETGTRPWNRLILCFSGSVLRLGAGVVSSGTFVVGALGHDHG